MTRTRVSRPRSSVPNQWDADGGWRTEVQLCAIASYGLNNGAKTASAIKNATMTSPKTALLRRKSRRTARRSGVSGTSFAAINLLLTAMSAMSRTQSRIDEDVGDVGKQIEHDVDRRRDEYDALYHRVVAIEDGVDDQLAEARNRENLFREHCTRQERPEFKRAERDDGGQRVAHGMLEDDRAFVEAFCARRPHVIAFEDLQHGAARVTHQDCGDCVTKNESRHNRRGETGALILCEGHVVCFF